MRDSNLFRAFLVILLLAFVVVEAATCDPRTYAPSCYTACCGDVQCDCSVTCPVNITRTTPCVDVDNFAPVCSFYACAAGVLGSTSICVGSDYHVAVNQSLTECTTTAFNAGCSLVQYEAALKCLAVLSCRSSPTTLCTTGCYAQSLSCFVDVGCKSSAAGSTDGSYCQKALVDDLSACSSSGLACTATGTCATNHIARCDAAAGLVNPATPAPQTPSILDSDSSSTSVAVIVLSIAFAVVIILLLVTVGFALKMYMQQKDAVQGVNGGTAGTPRQNYTPQTRTETPEMDAVSQSRDVGERWVRLRNQIRVEKKVQSTVFQLRQGLWQKGRLIGTGSSGRVYLCVVNDGNFVAMKQLNVANVTAEESNALCQELRLMSNLRHDNIIRYYYAEFDPDEKVINLWMEYMHGGSVADLIKKLDDPLSENVARRYVRQIVKGLAFLHEHHVAHRDIKGDNILIESQGTVKLADFGSAKLLEGVVGMSTDPSRIQSLQSYAMSMNNADSIVGTPLWMAPEVVNPESQAGSHGYNTRCDIWSLGICVAELLNKGQPPYPDFQSAWEAMFHIGNMKTPPTLPDVSPLCKDFMEKCLSIDARGRATAKQLLQHPWLTGIDNEDEEMLEDMTAADSNEFRHAIDKLEKMRRESGLLTPGSSTEYRLDDIHGESMEVRTESIEA